MKRQRVLLLVTTLTIMTILTGCTVKKGNIKINNIEEMKDDSSKKDILDGNIVEYDNVVIEGSEDFEELIEKWDTAEDSFKLRVVFDAILNDGSLRKQKNILRAGDKLGEKDIWFDGWYDKNRKDIIKMFDTEVGKYGFSLSEEDVYEEKGKIVTNNGLTSIKNINNADVSIRMHPNFGQTTVEYISRVNLEDYTEEFRDTSLEDIRELLGLEIKKEQMDFILNKYVNLTEEELSNIRRRMGTIQLSDYTDTYSIYVSLDAYTDTRVIQIASRVNGSGDPDLSVIFD